MQKILIPSLVAVMFIGEGSRLFRGKPHKNKWLKISNGDIILLDEVTIVNSCRGKDWKILDEFDSDISNIFKEQITRLDDIPLEEIDVGGEDRVLKKSTLHLFSREELIEFGKSKGVTRLNKNSTREKVIPQILRYLED